MGTWPGPTINNVFIGSGGPETLIEIDIGPIPRYSGSFIIIDSNIEADSRVIIRQAVASYTGKGTMWDEFSMSSIYALEAHVDYAHQATVFWTSGRTAIKGKIKFLYRVESN